MVFFFKTLFVAVSAAVAAVAVPSPTVQNITERAGTPISEGFDNGYYYKWWSDGNAESSYNNGPGGYFSITWGSNGYLYGGKGRNPGSKDRVLTYSGQYKSSGNSLLGVYGWARNPLTEYYIIDNFGSYNPASAGSPKGSFTVDGSMYDMYTATRVNQPSINGTATFQQFWSVRRNKRIGGTIDVGAHFNAWAKAGMNIGSELDYQILHCEGYFSMGLCAITVNDDRTTPTAPPQPSPTWSFCRTEWNQCGGDGYWGPTCCVSGTTCTWVPNTVVPSLSQWQCMAS